MQSQITIRLTVILFALTLASCQRIGMKKCNDDKDKFAIEDVKSTLGAVGNAVKFYYDDHQAFPPTFETLETDDYLMIDPVTRASWVWTLSKAENGHLLLRATSVENNCCGKKMTVTLDYETWEWIE